MGEVGDSIINALKKRTTSVAFGTYFFFWTSFHWQGVYAALFVSEDKIYDKFHLLKNEYLASYFFNFDKWTDILGYLIPLTLTLLFIWPIPKYILIHLYRIEQEHKTERLREKFKQEKLRREFEIKEIEQESEKVKAKTRLVTTRQKAEKVDPSIVWDEDYKKFRQDPAFKGFRQILEAVYEHGGATYIKQNLLAGENGFEVNGGNLMVADTLGLIDMTGKQVIRLTDKGKHFAKLYPHYASR